MDIAIEMEDQEVREVKAALFAGSRLLKTRAFLEINRKVRREPVSTVCLLPELKRERVADIESVEQTPQVKRLRPTESKTTSNAEVHDDSLASEATPWHSVNLNTFELEYRSPAAVNSKRSKTTVLKRSARTAASAASAVTNIFRKARKLRENGRLATRDSTLRYWRQISLFNPTGPMKSRLHTSHNLTNKESDMSGVKEKQYINMRKLDAIPLVTSLSSLSINDVQRLKQEQQRQK